MKHPIRIEDVCAVPWNTPYPEPPEPVGAVPCVCGFEHPWFEVGKVNYDEIRLACKCGRKGSWSRWKSDAVEAWNDYIAEARKGGE
jgi:hypothetical protein